ncbi:response regulator [Methylobacterium sp. J-070]|uniref:response regulator n=1 Tax=Methylobacterium sp. J-070 TaxID=2836650 RepID=UPI001FB97238|nr:response regulator [Methylobacterium sp. J-070]MCJ2049824.1 response regulator [Methylobacterium sp. J-070]
MPNTASLIRRPGWRGSRPFAGLPSSPLAYALLALAITLAGWNFTAGEAARREQSRQRELISRSDRLLSTMKDLETGMRGYALTGMPQYLEPYADALNRIGEETAYLDALDHTAVDPAVAALAPVRTLIEGEKAFSDRVVTIRRDQGSDAAAALVATGEGKRLMDAIRAATAAADQGADEALAESDHRDRLRYTILTAISLLCASLAVALLARLALVRRRESQRSSGLFEGVLANAPVGLGFLDGDLKIRHMNRALATMSERGFGADLGAPIWTLLPRLEEQLTPLLEAARDHGLVSADVPVTVPSESAPGGTRHFRMSFYPLRQDEGPAAIGVGVVVADVTTAALSEAQVRAGEALLRTVLDTLPVGVLIAEAPSGRITGHNARAEAILGHGVLPTQPGEGPARWVGFHEDGRPVESREWPLIQVVREGEPQAELEVDYQRGDGSHAWIGFAGAPMRDPNGALVGGVVVVSDIDARKRSEHVLAAAKEAAEEANRAKSEFLANMSHELRTPLSAVIGYSEMLQEEMEDAGQADLLPDMKKIEANARHLLGLINDVLDLSKIEAERMEVYPENLDVAATVRDVAATVEALVEKKGNALVLDLADGLGGAYTDATKLRQCLINLLSNAAKFTDGGRITLSARRQTDTEGDRLVFAVSDTGIGMSEEQVARLFQRFSQADASTTRRFGGTGLGLAITRAFAHMLGGDIAVASREGQGTTFTLTVLASASGGEDIILALPGSSPGVPRTNDEAVQGSEVLVIDDDQATRDLLARFLTKEGFHVATAPDGKAGLEQARTRRPRAILLDVTMPRMDGWAVLRALRADPDLGDLPVIMVTVLDEQNLAFSLGATDYLQKPIDWVQLKEAMERFRPKPHDGPVLIVDDDPDLRTLITTQLTRDGWTVVTAADGRVGLTAVADHKPRLILLDLMMPELDGFGFLRLLRTRPEWYDIPVVVLTAKDVTAEDFRQLAGQADRVVQKVGLSFSDLSALLRTLYGPDPAEHRDGEPGSDHAAVLGITTMAE